MKDRDERLVRRQETLRYLDTGEELLGMRVARPESDEEELQRKLKNEIEKEK